MKNNLISITIISGYLFFCSCKNEKRDPMYADYPPEIGKIMITKCAVAGCHNDASRSASGGLSMENWNKLFEGGTGSACVIPYRSDFSTMCYFINTYSDLGPAIAPTMPYGKPALSHDDVVLIKSWIDRGASDRNGFVKFSDKPERKKIYVTNQGCDVVTVMDEETLLPMRYIDVGAVSDLEYPRMIKVSPDGQYWYVVFLFGDYLEKYRTSDNAFMGRVNINSAGTGQWNTLVITANSDTAYCVDWTGWGQIAKVDLTTMTAVTQGGFPASPLGCALNQNENILYVTEQAGDKIMKIPVDNLSGYTEVPLYSSPPPVHLYSGAVKFSPDWSKYFVTCLGTNEVRVMQTSNDSLLTIIPVGFYPSEIAVSGSVSTPYIFVTCTEDSVHVPPQGKGSVAVIDYTTNTLVKYIYTGYQPHGIEVDDSKKLVVVANSNYSATGPLPHHTSGCGGRNGNVSFIDLNTLTMITQPGSSTTKKVEVAVYPYSISIRH